MDLWILWDRAGLVRRLFHYRLVGLEDLLDLGRQVRLVLQELLVRELLGYQIHLEDRQDQEDQLGRVVLEVQGVQVEHRYLAFLQYQIHRDRQGDREDQKDLVDQLGMVCTAEVSSLRKEH